MKVSGRIKGDNVLVINIKGRNLRENDALDARLDILNLIDQIQWAPKVVLNMKKVKLVDSSGFTALAVVSMMVAQKHGRIVLACVGEDIKDDIKRMSFANAFDGIYGSEDEAVKSFNAP